MKIEIIEHCFGQYVNVDGIDVCDRDDVYLKQDVQDKRLLLIEELKANMDDVHTGVWIHIAENLIDFFDKNVDESSSDVCEQCGNWNSNQVYERKQALIDIMEADEKLGLYNDIVDEKGNIVGFLKKDK